MEAVVFKGIKKQFDGFELNIPKLGIKKGYITGFIGENGAGKTTTIKLMLDMLIPDAGEVLIDGMRVSENAKALKEKIGYVGEPTGYPQESKLKNIKRMVKPFYKDWDEKLFNSYMARFGLKEDKKYGELSTGQKKQFVLIVALAHKPELIILDEPTAGLDPVVRSEMIDLLMEHMQNEEVTIFYSTHITSDLEKAGDYLVYIRDGRIEMQVEKDELLNDYCIVKGPKHLFDQEIQKELLGYKQTSLGGEALVRSKALAKELFGDEVKYVVPTIEDVMVLLSSKRGE